MHIEEHSKLYQWQGCFDKIIVFSCLYLFVFKRRMYNDGIHFNSIPGSEPAMKIGTQGDCQCVERFTQIIYNISCWIQHLCREWKMRNINWIKEFCAHIDVIRMTFLVLCQFSRSSHLVIHDYFCHHDWKE